MTSIQLPCVCKGEKDTSTNRGRLVQPKQSGTRPSQRSGQAVRMKPSSLHDPSPIDSWLRLRIHLRQAWRTINAWESEGRDFGGLLGTRAERLADTERSADEGEAADKVGGQQKVPYQRTDAAKAKEENSSPMLAEVRYAQLESRLVSRQFEVLRSNSAFALQDRAGWKIAVELKIDTTLRIRNTRATNMSERRSPALYADHQKKSKHASTIHQKLPVCLRLLAKQRGGSDRGVQSSLTPHPVSREFDTFQGSSGRTGLSTELPSPKEHFWALRTAERMSRGESKGEGWCRKAKAGVERRRLVSKGEGWCRKAKAGVEMKVSKGEMPRAESTAGWRRRRSKRLEGGGNHGRRQRQRPEVISGEGPWWFGTRASGWAKIAPPKLRYKNGAFIE
ncbi:hypothetical protein B0H16DRAFT_1478383 [Mycena metata]|uniref:Uncharacterized protein n=1 Tax=Mycena metata TaxID=1033252 RepID=A0AAD7H7E7_9AGAR|nr:hypothetical protein B0H16DRAFT_1478383 [Mycena metata]